MKMIIHSVIGKRALALTIPLLLILQTTLLTNCKKNSTYNNNNTNTNPPGSSRVDMQLVADGFVSPLGVVASPDNTGRLFVIDQSGKIWIIDQSGNKLPTPFF